MGDSGRKFRGIFTIKRSVARLGPVAARLSIGLAAMAAVLLPGGAAEADVHTVAYLTFDDGPSLDGGTAEVLAVLAKYDVTATFFMVGENIARDREQARAVIDAGHLIASHTYNHLRLTDLSQTQVHQQLQRNQDIIASLGVPRPACFRPPWGASNEEIRQVASGLGLEQVIWTLDSEDWRRQGPGPVRAKLELIGPNEDVLMHDGYTRGAETATALDAFLRDHRSEYDFQTLPECRVGSGVERTTTTAPPTTAPPPTTTAPPPEGPLAEGPDSKHCRYGPEGKGPEISDKKSGSLYRLYCAYFARYPDAEGFAYWQASLSPSLSLREVSGLFRVSGEFQQTYGNLGDEEFVSLVYQNVLGRSPDPDGAAYWVNLLAEGKLSHDGVMLYFSESPELRSLSNTP